MHSKKRRMIRIGHNTGFKFVMLCLLSSVPLLAAEELSLEEKVGQLLIVHFRGDEVNEDARILIQEVGVGGIIYFNWANTLSSPSQVRALSHGLQEMARIPLLIAIDQEGGRVARLQEGFIASPGNQALAETGNPQLAYEMAFAVGKELKAVGINLNFAPVVDVNSNPDNPVIGTRAFSGNPEIVVQFGAQALKGYHDAGVMTSLKHFPGHGDVAADSHFDLPVLNKSVEALAQVELLPFMQLHEQAETIMVAHILVPALDAENCASLSEKVIQGVLREQMGFKGVVISDSLVMQGVLNQCGTVDEAAIRALKAGNDLIILGGLPSLDGDEAGVEVSVQDAQRIHKNLVSAVRSGRIPLSRIDAAVGRVLAMKR